MNEKPMELQPFLIHLYGEPSTKALDLLEIARYLRDRLGEVKADVRGEFVGYHLAERQGEEFAKRLAGIRVKDLDKRVTIGEPTYGEIEFEKRLFREVGRRHPAVLYDGFLLQSLFAGILDESEADLGHIHIAFTSRLFGTFDESDRRYHARVIVCGHPSIISTTGVVEAPAKPREFYLAMKNYQSQALGPMVWERLKEEFRGRFIDYDDDRMTEVMKGYVMQAIFYHLFQEPFCSEKRCRLYNSHWQEEVIEAQLSSPEYCDYHGKLILEIRRSILKQAKSPP